RTDGEPVMTDAVLNNKVFTGPDNRGIRFQDLQCVLVFMSTIIDNHHLLVDFDHSSHGRIHLTCVTCEEADSWMGAGARIDVFVRCIDTYHRSSAQCITGMCERQRAAAEVIADFDDDVRTCLPEDFLIDPEIQRALQRWDALVPRALHNPLMQ